MATAKRRFFKRSEGKKVKPSYEAKKAKPIKEAKPVLLPVEKKEKKPSLVSETKPKQPQKPIVSVINRKLFGNYKGFFKQGNVRLGLIGLLVVLGIIWNMFVLKQLVGNVGSFVQLFGQRSKLSQEMNTWENITNQYPDYRDAYVEGAILAYRLGDRQKEEYFLSKLELLDPNFPLTKTLEQLTNLQNLNQ